MPKYALQYLKFTYKRDFERHENITKQVRFFPYNLVLLQ